MIIDRFCRRKFEIDLKALKDYAWRMKTKIVERYATQLPPNGESMQNLFVKEEEFRRYAKDRLPEDLYWAIYS